MSTIYMSQLSTAFPLMEEDHHHQDHHQGHFQAFTLPKDPPILFPFVISNSSPSENSSTLSYGSDQHLMQHHVMLDQPQHMIGGSSSVFSTPFPTVESIRDDMIERSYSYDPYDMEKLQATSGSLKIGKWTAPAPAAKMRITRKTSDPGVKKPRKRAQAYEDHGHMGGMNQALGVIRTCSDCNTTKTPLWRSGPCGPKSLCNACGIRQRKARRAMMATGAAPATDVGAAKAAAAGEAAVTVHPPKVKKEKRAADVDRSLPFKKRCKVVQDHTATNSAASTTVEAAAEPPKRSLPSSFHHTTARRSDLRLAPLLLHARPNLALRPRSPAMSSLRAISALLHTEYYSSSAAAGRVGPRRLGGSFRVPSKATSALVLDEVARAAGGVRRRAATRAASWDSEKSPYETLELERDADDETIKVAYRRLAKFYHPDVYDGKGTLEEGETAEARFIKIQAAYELLIDDERRKAYDKEHFVNPLKASQAWMEWVMKKRKAFDKRGDMAVAAWAEQQQRELTLRARRLSRSKVDPEEERRLLAKERKASMEFYSTTLKRHTLVLRKRDILRKREEEDKMNEISRLLAAEGLELDTDEDDDDTTFLK